MVSRHEVSSLPSGQQRDSNVFGLSRFPLYFESLILNGFDLFEQFRFASGIYKIIKIALLSHFFEKVVNGFEKGSGGLCSWSRHLYSG